MLDLFASGSHHSFCQRIGFFGVVLLTVRPQIADLFIGHMQNVIIAQLPAKFIEHVIDELHELLHY